MNGTPPITSIGNSYMRFDRRKEERQRKKQTRKSKQFAEYLNKFMGVDVRA
jgi:hypothetical protein